MKVEQITSDFQILGSSIKSFHIDNDFVRMSKDIEKEIDVSYTIDAPIQLGEEESDPLAGIVHLLIDIHIFDNELEAKLNLETEGCFILENSRDEKELEKMLAISGPAALYSLSRGFISSVTSQMCLNGTIMIPMVNLVEFRNATK